MAENYIHSYIGNVMYTSKNNERTVFDPITQDQEVISNQ